MNTPDLRESDVELVDAVHGFMQIGGQSTGKFNARQACLYTGLQLEEMAEKIDVIIGGTLTDQQRHGLYELSRTLKQFSAEFKQGLHEGDILRCDHAELIDADFDTAWVSIGSLISVSPNPEGAIQHGTFTNLAKFPGGVATRDENGKIKKPADWKAPDFEPYTDKTIRD